MSESYTAIPLTYSGCPFKQAILDKHGRECESCGLNAGKTFVVWATKINGNISPENLEKLRQFKLNMINDFLMNLSGNQMNFSAISNCCMNKCFVKSLSLPIPAEKPREDMHMMTYDQAVKLALNFNLEKLE